MKINYEGKEIMVTVIGGFEYNEKKYAVCSYVDEENTKLVIVETYTDETGMHTKDIAPEDLEGVRQQFDLIREGLMEDNYE